MNRDDLERRALQLGLTVCACALAVLGQGAAWLVDAHVSMRRRLRRSDRG